VSVDLDDIQRPPLSTHGADRPGATKDTAHTISMKPTRQMHRLSAAVIARRTNSLPDSET
jgi:hypothetical protein